jgi:hypothetical protein
MTPFEKVNTLLLVCVEQGRIADVNRPHYMSLAVAHFDDTLNLLAGSPATTDEGNDPRKWTFNKLQRDAPAVLNALRQQEPARYEALKDLYVAELKRPKTAEAGKGYALDKDGTPIRKRRVKMNPSRAATTPQRAPRSEFERMQRQEPAALEKMRQQEPVRYERLRQEHVTKLKQAK